MTRCLIALLALLSVPALAQDNKSAADEQKEGFVPLFNGKDLAGWTVVGQKKDAFQVEADGVLSCTGGGGGWLRTNDEYKDFVLKLDYKISPSGNSGVFVRATKDGDPAFTGMEVQIMDDAGKDASPQGNGALYDEVAPAKNMSKPAGEWNSYEIMCFGNELRVALNGEQLYHINLDTNADKHHKREKLSMRAATGFIGLQDHGNPVWFRNIRIKPLDRGKYPGNTAGWISLFDGKSLDGWKSVGPAKWEVRDGSLVTSGGRGYLHTTGTYRDVEFRAKVRVSKGGNSGVFIRARHPDPNKPDPNRAFPWPVGPEAQINNNDRENPTGSIYNKHRAAEIISSDGQWFDFYVLARDDWWQVRVNGRAILDVRDSSAMDPGFIALQAHDADSVIEFRDIQIRPLDGAKQ
ncbi:MAG: hypothetical protein CHACPFDD_03573 [Phycisphaerae bacterium]|nr:hypothetical protein [Phycisphaerae bacterium]